jgi:WD40 repeat protein
MKRKSILVLAILVLALVPGIAWAGDRVAPLKRALGAAFLAKAELALLKGRLNSGKVYLAAAHEADPSISVFRLKAFDMMYKDFPYLNNMIPGYRGGPVAFSMDGRFVAYSTRDSVSRLDLETGKLKSVGRPEIWMLQIEVSPKGRFVAVCDNKGNLALCDMERETQVGQFAFRKEEPRGLTSIKMSFSQDENSIAAYYPYSDKEALYFLRTMDLSVTRTVPITLGFPPSLGPIRFLSDGSLLIGMRGRTELVDPSTMRSIKTLAPRMGWDVDYLPDKNLLAVGGSGSIEVFNTATQEKVAEYQAASHNIVLVRFLAAGRYIVYASPKNESGIIDCTSGKPLQVFKIGRDAAVSPSRYQLLARGKVIDLSACRPYEANLSAEMPHATRPSGSTIPEAVHKAMSETSEKALLRSGGSIRLALNSKSGNLEAYGTRDGRTFIYDRRKGEVSLLLTDHYTTPKDFAFFPDDIHFVRLCSYNNGNAGAVEVYTLTDGHRRTLHLYDPPKNIAIAPDLRVAAILDRKNRVFLSVLPSLDTTVELLPATQTKRQIFIDQKTKTLVVKTDSSIVSYDLRKVAEDRAFPTYEEAVKLYGVSLEELEPLWSLVHY